MKVDEAITARGSHANELGRIAFRQGRPCDPSIPMMQFTETDRGAGIYLMESWMRGWADESAMYPGAEGCVA